MRQVTMRKQVVSCSHKWAIEIGIRLVWPMMILILVLSMVSKYLRWQILEKSQLSTIGRALAKFRLYQMTRLSLAMRLWTKAWPNSLRKGIEARWRPCLHRSISKSLGVKLCWIMLHHQAWKSSLRSSLWWRDSGLKLQSRRKCILSTHLEKADRFRKSAIQSSMRLRLFRLPKSTVIEAWIGRGIKTQVRITLAYNFQTMSTNVCADPW